VVAKASEELHPEAGHGMFLRNVDNLLQDYTVLQIKMPGSESSYYFSYFYMLFVYADYL
jgi:hypothetical protein